MAHAQKPDFVFRRNGRVHLNWRGRQFSRMLISQVCASVIISNAGYTMFRGSVKSTGYPLHSPDFPSLPLPCVTVCHQVSNALYLLLFYGKNGYANAPQYYLVRTLPVLFRVLIGKVEDNMQGCQLSLIMLPINGRKKYLTAVPSSEYRSRSWHQISDRNRV